MHFTKQHLWALVASASLTLAGCGSGSSDKKTEAAPAEPSRVSLTGLAVKGVMAGADITVTSLDGMTVYGATVTGSDGTYSLADMDIPLNTPVLVTMTTNSTTLLTCDAAAGCQNGDTREFFGTKYTYNDSSFKMTAILGGVTTDVASASLMVTPLTHMAAERAIKENKTTAAEITAVNKATAVLLGLDNVDIATVVPADITDSGSSSATNNAQRYGALVAAIANVATTKQQSLTDVVTALATEYADKGGLVANSSDEEEVDLEDIFGGAADSADAANLDAVAAEYSLEESQASAEPEDEVVAADETGGSDTEGLTEAELKAAAVADAVSLLEDLNNWHTDLAAVNSDTLVNTLNAEGEELAALVETVATNSALASTVQSLLVTQVCGFTYRDDATGDLVCADDTLEPGPLFGATGFTAMLVATAPYVESYVAVSEGAGYTGTLAMTLADIGISAQMEEELDGAGENLTITATLLEGSLVGMAFSGSTDALTVTSLNFALAQSGNSLVATISDMDLTTASGGALAAGMHFTAAGKVTLPFDSPEGLDAFISEGSEDGLTGVQIELNSEIAANDDLGSVASLAVTFDVGVNSLGNLGITVGGGISAGNDAGDSLAGTLSAEVGGLYQDSLFGWVFDADDDSYVKGSLDVAMTMADGEDQVSFTGMINVAEVYAEADSESEYRAMGFDGSFAVVSGSDSTSFEGMLNIREDYLKDAEGSYLTDRDGMPISVPTSVELNGSFSASRSGFSIGSLDVSGVARLDNLAEVAAMMQIPEYPDYGDEIGSITASSVTDSADTANNSYTHTLNINLEESIAGVQAYAESLGWSNVSIQPGYFESSSYTATLDSTNDCFADDLPNTSYCLVSVTFDDGMEDSYGVSLATSDIDNPEVWGPVLNAEVVYDDFFSVWLYVYFDQGFVALNSSASYMEEDQVDLPDSTGYSVEYVYIDEVDPIETLLSAETLDSYLNFTFALDVQVTALGYDDAVVRLVGERSDFDQAIGTLRLGYGDRMIDINIDTAALDSASSSNMSISNGTTSMTITATCETDSVDTADTSLATCDDGAVEFGGNIFSGGYQVGTLEVREGMPVFKFDDGSNYDLIVTPSSLISKQ